MASSVEEESPGAVKNDKLRPWKKEENETLILFFLTTENFWWRNYGKKRKKIFERACEIFDF